MCAQDAGRAVASRSHSFTCTPTRLIPPRLLSDALQIALTTIAGKPHHNSGPRTLILRAQAKQARGSYACMDGCTSSFIAVKGQGPIVLFLSAWAQADPPLLSASPVSSHRTPTRCISLLPSAARLALAPALGPRPALVFGCVHRRSASHARQLVWRHLVRIARQLGRLPYTASCRTYR